jgi:phage terminase large subunit-like protein
MNQWTESVTVYISLDAWDACGSNYDEEDLLGRPCYGGLDLATTTDLAAFSLIFPPLQEHEPYKSLVWFWLPEDNTRERVMRDQVKYDQWADEGHIKLTHGNVIDYGNIKGHILGITERFNLRQINYDPWNATGLCTDLMNEGIQMVQHRQGYGSMSGPTKDLLAYVLSKRLLHDAQPVLRWNIANLTVREDDNGNCCPSKKLSREKIDGAVALIMSLGGALGARQDDNMMRYSGEELLIL